ncbi:MAG: hypothetical protein IJA15_08955 [Clostridia bacterium]|nr:hypothetical protein [Clostridia bacterium]
MKKFLFYPLCALLLFIAFALIYNPAVYMKACLEGLTVWAVTVAPSLLPFFFLTLLFTNTQIAQKFALKLQKPMALLYNAPPISAFVQLMSFISGYPMGAKLIAELYKENHITSEEATKISIFTSTSGPMFIVGSVGVGMLGNKRAGMILLISHLLSAILNGIYFRKMPVKNKNTKPNILCTPTQNILYDCAFGATLSCLIVGAFIAVFYVFCKILEDFSILKPFVFLFGLLFKDTKKALAFCAGLIECTNGCILFAKTSGILTLPLTAFIISFGGASIIFQSVAFLKEANVKIKTFLLGKLIQALTAFAICFILSLVFV